MTEKNEIACMKEKFIAAKLKVERCKEELADAQMELNHFRAALKELKKSEREEAYRIQIKNEYQTRYCNPCRFFERSPDQKNIICLANRNMKSRNFENPCPSHPDFLKQSEQLEEAEKDQEWWNLYE